MMRSRSASGSAFGASWDNHTGNRRRCPDRSSQSGRHIEASASDRALLMVGTMAGSPGLPPGETALQIAVGGHEDVVLASREPTEDPTGQLRFRLNDEVNGVVWQVVVVTRALPRLELHAVLADGRHEVPTTWSLGERHFHPDPILSPIPRPVAAGSPERASRDPSRRYPVRSRSASG